MTGIPAGWVETRLGDIAETSLGKMLDRGKATGTHLVPYLRNVNVQWGRIDLEDVLTMDISPEEQEFFELREGDLLVCEGGEVGRCAIWPGGVGYMAFQKALHRVRPYGGIDPKYLRYYLEYMSLSGALLSFSTGSTIKHLPQQQLRKLPINVPPLSEQQRIVAAIEDHLSRLEAANRYIVKAKDKVRFCITAIYTKAVEGNLVKVGPGECGLAACLIRRRQDRWRDEFGSRKYRDPSAPDLESHPVVAPGWHLMSLEEVTDPVRVIRYGILMPKVEEGGEVPYVEVKDLVGDTLVNKSLRRTSRELDEKFSGARLKAGDVVMAVRGSYDRSAVVPVGLENANISRDVVRVAPLDGLRPQYLNVYLRSGFVRGYLRRHARGVAVKGVNVSSLRVLPVAFPPTAVQDQIIEIVERHVSVAMSLLLAIERLKARAAHLRRSLLSQAFSGELVMQDPSDEPASALLDRICSERSIFQKRIRRNSSRLSLKRGSSL